MHPKTNCPKLKQPTWSPWTLNHHLQTRRRFLDGQSQRTADWVLDSSQPDRQLVSCKQSKNRQGTSHQSAVHSPDVRVPDNKKLTKQNWKIYRHWAVQQKLFERHTERISKPQWGHSKKLFEENHSLRMESPQEQNCPQQVGPGCFCDNLKWINSAQHAQILDQTPHRKVTTGRNLQLSSRNVAFQDQLRLNEKWHLGNWMYRFGTSYGIRAKNQLIPPIQPVHWAIKLRLASNNEDQHKRVSEKGQKLTIHDIVRAFKIVFRIQHNERLDEHLGKNQETDWKRDEWIGAVIKRDLDWDVRVDNVQRHFTDGCRFHQTVPEHKVAETTINWWTDVPRVSQVNQLEKISEIEQPSCNKHMYQINIFIFSYPFLLLVGIQYYRSEWSFWIL